MEGRRADAKQCSLDCTNAAARKRYDERKKLEAELARRENPPERMDS
jgi:hypothetical protein